MNGGKSADKAPIKAAKKTKAVVRVAKSGKQHGRIADIGQKALAEAEKIEEKIQKLEKEVVKKAKKAPTKKKTIGRKKSQRYLAAKKKVDPTKLYSLNEAIKLLKEVSLSKFTGSVDAHLTTKKTGFKGTIIFPFPTGKKQLPRIADEKLLKELEQGKINFTLLVAPPAMMPQLAKYAKILGPKGLMPNPKNGTISDQPEQVIKKLTGSIAYKNEAQQPLIHLKIAQLDQPESQIEANFKALIQAIERKNIQKAVLAPTMGPGIKINLNY